LTKIDKQITETDREKFIELAEGKNLTEVALNLANAYDPDEVDKNVRRIFNLLVDAEPNEVQINETIKQFSNEAIKPFDNPRLREFLETVRQKIYQIIDETNTDRVVRSEFDTTAKENADEIINNFRKFIDDNKDEITALRILYSQPERRKELTYKMIRELNDALTNPPYYLTLEQVWNAYQRVKPNLVNLPAGRQGRTPQRMLTDIITLIRFELRFDETLEPYSEVVNRRFKEWVFKRNAGPVQFNDEQMNWLRMIKDHIVSSVRIEVEDFDRTPFDGEGGLGKFYKLFGSEYEKLLDELNKELAA
ncbi:MAG: restriction endonuclease subunit R, partial [Ignavibacteriales bacterium CG_4_9_14_3_um_filter_30_11]